MDPVTLAVAKSALDECVREMDAIIVASAFSPIISEGRDCASAVFDSAGDLIAQGEFSMPLFIASLQSVVGNVVATGGLQDGDLILTNNPDVGGTHIQDVKLVMPLFIDEELAFYLGTAGHWLDIGGAVPGGWHPESRSVFAEGLVLDGIRLVNRGRVNDDVMSVLLSNARAPAALAGDIAAHRSALEVGRDRLCELIEKFGLPTLREVVATMRDRSEAAVRDRLRRLAGTATSRVEYCDNDGVIDRPIEIACELRIDGDELSLDFSASSDVSVGPMNLPEPGTVTACYIALKHLWPDIPVNAGCFRPIHVITRPGSVVSARRPAPVAGFSEVMHRVIDTVFGCFSDLPFEDVFGAPFSTTSGISITSTIDGQPSLAAWYLEGGYGGSALGDGLVAGTAINSTAQLPPLEIFEHRSPVRFIERSIRPDSGGAGTFRGGCGSVLEMEFLDVADVAFLGDRTRYRPFGVKGGDAGAAAVWQFTIDGETWEPPMGGKGLRRVGPGDRLRVLTPGGGGWGDPSGRSKNDRERDRTEGYVTEE